MTDEERAEWLASAIDQLLDGRSPAPAGALGAPELEALIRVARARLGAGQARAQASLRHEGVVWREVLARLEARRQRAAAAAPEQTPDTAPMVSASSPPEAEAKDLRHIVTLRKQMTDDMTSLAARHRDHVWQQVQARILANNPERAPFPFLQPSPAMVGGRPDGELEAVLAGVHAEQRAAPAAPSFWARLAGALSGRSPLPQRRGGAHTSPWPALATAAAGLALVVAALGPLPATGLAGHPAVVLVQSLGEFTGLTETASPPDASGQGAMVQGQDMDAKQASTVMGLPLLTPANAPTGFTLKLSRFYPQPLTAQQPGLFLLGYTGGDGSTLLIYQEAAGGTDLAAFPGSATAATLAGGIPATYFEGSWQASDGRVFWSDADSHNLVFDRAGVRTIIRHTGGPGDAVTLVSLAAALLAPAQ